MPEQNPLTENLGTPKINLKELIENHFFTDDYSIQVQTYLNTTSRYLLLTPKEYPGIPHKSIRIWTNTDFNFDSNVLKIRKEIEQQKFKPNQLNLSNQIGVVVSRIIFFPNTTKDQLLAQSIDNFDNTTGSGTRWHKRIIGSLLREQYWGLTPILFNKLHRINKPAVILYDSVGKIEEEAYYLNGKRHNSSGPAIIHYDDNSTTIHSETYYFNGEYVGDNLGIHTEEQMQNYLLLR